MAELATPQPQQPPSPPSPGNEDPSSASPATFTFPLRPAHSAPSDSDEQKPAANEDDATAATSAAPAVAATLPSKGQHKRARTSISPLPDFTFNASSSSADIPGPSTFPPISHSPVESSAQNSPNRGRRHRRSASEYVGGTSNPTAFRSQPMKVDFSQSAADDQACSPQFSFPLRSPPEGGCSETVLVEDDQPTSFDTPDNPPVLGTDSSNAPANSSERSILRRSSPTSPPARVLFSDNVEVIPRLQPDTNLELDSAASTPMIGDTVLAGRSSPSPLKQDSGWPSDSSDALTSYPHTPSSLTWHSPMSDLDQNFDHDPTGAETLDGEDCEHYSSNPYGPTYASGGQAYIPRSNTFESGMIDLDQALPPPDEDGMSHERRVNQIRNFQTARRSMHSSGAMSGFMGPGMHYHRRAESAPLLAPITFESNFEGFPSNPGMENVFEEEEEEEVEEKDATPQLTPNIIESTQIKGIEESNSTNKGLGIATVHEKINHLSIKPPATTSSRSSRIAKDGLFYESDFSKDETDSGLRPDRPLAPPQAPFMTPDTPSGSDFSSPQRPRFSHASSEPSLVLPHPSDDVPSFRSSRSTMESGGPSQQQSTGLRSVVGRISMSTASLGKSDDTRKKRGSIVSLSRLIGSSHSDAKSDAGSDDRRYQGSEGEAMTRKKKVAKLKRLFALLNRTEHAEKG